jgi:hypothetical protein
MDLKETVLPIAIVSIVFLTSAIIVATVFLFLHRAKELKHQTIRLALEKGQPLPPGLLEERRPRGNDLSTGVKDIFFGVGLSLFFFFVHPQLWPVGLIPGFLGLGYLAAHALTGRQQPGAPTAG